MKITSALARVVGHLYGDDCLDKRGKMYYINKNQVLISNFVKDVKSVFGNATKVSFYNKSDGVRRVYVEKRIADTLKREFKELETRSKIPKKIAKGPKKIIINKIGRRKSVDLWVVNGQVGG